LSPTVERFAIIPPAVPPRDCLRPATTAISRALLIGATIARCLHGKRRFAPDTRREWICGGPEHEFGPLPVIASLLPQPADAPRQPLPLPRVDAGRAPQFSTLPWRARPPRPRRPKPKPQFHRGRMLQEASRPGTLEVPDSFRYSVDPIVVMVETPSAFKECAALRISRREVTLVPFGDTELYVPHVTNV
jgi:hypothetical protein